MPLGVLLHVGPDPAGLDEKQRLDEFRAFQRNPAPVEAHEDLLAITVGLFRLDLVPDDLDRFLKVFAEIPDMVAEGVFVQLPSIADSFKVGLNRRVALVKKVLVHRLDGFLSFRSKSFEKFGFSPFLSPFRLVNQTVIRRISPSIIAKVLKNDPDGRQPLLPVDDLEFFRRFRISAETLQDNRLQQIRLFIVRADRGPGLLDIAKKLFRLRLAPTVAALVGGNVKLLAREILDGFDFQVACHVQLLSSVYNVFILSHASRTRRCVRNSPKRASSSPWRTRKDSEGKSGSPVASLGSRM